MATQIVGSNMKADNGYGQNGYSGASSDLPGQRTTSGVLPQTDLASAQADRKKFQERTVDTKNVPTAFGMKGAAKGPTLGAPVRPAAKF